jgi:4'-phosphopantetheinyl transferase
VRAVNKVLGGDEAAVTEARRVPVPDNDLVLWLCPLAIPAHALTDYDSFLSTQERARAVQFGTQSLRQRYIAGRGWLRLLLGQHLGIAPSSVPIVRGFRGRPILESPESSLDFNVSHTRGTALIGFLHVPDATTRIGIDIEHEDRDVGADRLARRYLTQPEREVFFAMDADARRKHFIRLWTVKEAMSKATGDGLRAPMGRLDIDLAAGPRLMSGPPPYEPGAWRLLDVPLPGGFVATAARWRGRAPS